MEGLTVMAVLGLVFTAAYRVREAYLAYMRRQSYPPHVSRALEYAAMNPYYHE